MGKRRFTSRSQITRGITNEGRPPRPPLYYFFLDVRFFDERFLPPFFELFFPPFFEPFFEPFLEGTLSPSARASDSPIAMACLRLVTFLPERPLFNSPRFISCMALSTFLPAFLPYLAIHL